MNHQKSSQPYSIHFQQTLTGLGIKAEIKEFPESTRTAQEAADAIGCEIGQIVKSIIFKGAHSEKGILVLTSGKNRVSEGLIRDIIGENLSKASANFVKEQSGYSIGAVPPFGHRNPLHVFIDEDLGEYEILWAAAGSPHAVFPIRFNDLIKVSQGTVTKVKEEL